MPADPRAYAAALYETLHRLDAEGLDWIAVEPPPDAPSGPASWTACAAPPRAPEGRKRLAHGASRGKAGPTGTAPEDLDIWHPGSAEPSFLSLGLRPKPRGLTLCGQDRRSSPTGRRECGFLRIRLPPRSRHRCRRSGCSSAEPYPPHRQFDYERCDELVNRQGVLSFFFIVCSSSSMARYARTKLSLQFRVNEVSFSDRPWRLQLRTRSNSPR